MTTRLKMWPLLSLASLACAVVLFSACGERYNMPTEAGPAQANATLQNVKPAQDPDAAQITRLMANVNAKLTAGGSKLHVGYPWMFRVGQGVDPFGSLRTGTRWISHDVAYMIDESKLTTDVSKSDAMAALTSAYASWTNVGNTYIATHQIPDNGKNNDILDGIIRDDTGACVDILDLSSDVLERDANGNPTGFFTPTTDIVVGGWLPAEYFKDCLGSEDIIAVTWTFSGPDTNGDQYEDTQYVEQFYNTRFKWTTTDAVYLDFDAPMDIESISVHEDGHTLGLGHFGGPIVDQQFKIKGQDRVFNPEAVMNPYYIGGEKRAPLSTDVAGLRTLYTGHVGR